MVPLYVIERIGGADISQSEEEITIQKGGNTMLLTLNSTQASLNESLITLPQAPVQVNDVVMVPIRAVMEGLGATIDWEGETRTVLVSFQEQRDGMSPEDLLVKITDSGGIQYLQGQSRNISRYADVSILIPGKEKRYR